MAKTASTNGKQKKNWASELFQDTVPHLAGNRPQYQWPVALPRDWIPDFRFLQQHWAEFRQMQNDPVIESTHETKVSMVLADGWQVSPHPGPAATEDARKKQADFIRWVFNNIPGTIESFIAEALESPQIGFFVAEKKYGIAKSGPFAGYKIIDALRALDPSTVGFKLDDNGIIENLKFTVAGKVVIEDAWSVPYQWPIKFIHYSHEGKYGSPYGRGDLLKAYRAWWLKEQAMGFWAVFVERYASPGLVGKFKPGASKEMRAALLTALDMQSNSINRVIPEDTTVELMEAKSPGEAFHIFMRYQDDEIVKAILGATLVSGEGGRVGSMALGNVHYKIMEGRVNKLKRDICEKVMRSGIIQWLIDMNFDQVDGYPVFSLGGAEAQDAVSEVTVVGVLTDKGYLDPNIDGAKVRARFGYEDAESDDTERPEVEQPADPADDIVDDPGVKSPLKKAA